MTKNNLSIDFKNQEIDKDKVEAVTKFYAEKRKNDVNATVNRSNKGITIRINK